MQVVYRFAALLYYVNKSLFIRFVAGGERRHAVISCGDGFERFEHAEIVPDQLVLRISIAEVFEFVFDLFVAEEGEYRFRHFVRIAAAAASHVNRDEMIAVRMRYKAILDRGKVQAVREHMRKGIAGEIYKKIVIHKSLRTGAEVPSARFFCAETVFAIAENGGPALCRRSA